MKDKQIKLIYDYMGWNFDHYLTEKACNASEYVHTLDSNSAWEVVQELSKKGEWWGFHEYAISNMPEGVTRQHEETRWFMEADNFFRCFGEFLEQREGK